MAKKIASSKKALTERIQILANWESVNKASRCSKNPDKLFLEKIELLTFHLKK